MRAPHVDEYSDQTMKAHEYLVLKTGQADYHEHLDEPKPDDNEEEHKPVRKKAEAVRRTFGKDESPGFYGEVADYWRNFGNEQLTQSSAEEEDQVGLHWLHKYECLWENDILLLSVMLVINFVLLY